MIQNNPIQRFFSTAPFHNSTVHDIQQCGNFFVQQLYSWIKNNQHLTLDSRILGLRPHQKVTLFGVVCNCRFRYSYQVHQAVPVLLLSNVYQLNLEHEWIPVTNHMWVNIDLSLMANNHNLTIQNGSCLVIKGTVKIYHGRLSRGQGIKLGLGIHTQLLQYGYPLLPLNDQLSLIPLRSSNYILSVRGYAPQIFLGNQVSNQQKKVIQQHHLKVGFTSAFLFKKILLYGKYLYHHKSNYKHANLYCFHTNDTMHLFSNLKWCHKHINKINKRRHIDKITDAHKVWSHPHLIFSRIIKGIPKNKFRRSFYYLLAHHALPTMADVLNKWR